MDNISLRFTGGGSDKVYNGGIVPSEGGGFRVTFWYGKYGSTLHAAHKTPAGVTYEVAKKEFDKVVKKQLREGYQVVGGPAAEFATVSNEKQQTGNLPQLLTPIEESDLEQYFTDDRWVMQEKKDGERRMIDATESFAKGINRKGELVSLPQSMANDMAEFVTFRPLLDGEQIGDLCYAFDLLKLNGNDVTGMPYENRYTLLSKLLDLGVLNSHILRVPLYDGEAEKRAVFNIIKTRRGEGVVFKDRQAPYTVGRGNTQVKFKFTATATVQIHNTGSGKRSVKMSVDYNGALRPVGNVTIPVNFEIPESGVLAEVRYLYIIPGGSLYGPPIYLGPRPDKDTPDAYSSLKFKEGTLEEDDTE